MVDRRAFLRLAQGEAEDLPADERIAQAALEASLILFMAAGIEVTTEEFVDKLSDGLERLAGEGLVLDRTPDGTVN